MSYYTNNNSSKGTLNVSDYVFSQIAQEKLEQLSKNELKDAISLKLAKDKSNVTTKIDNNKITVQVDFFAVRNSDVQKSVNTVQQACYDAIYEAMELSNVKVNVSVIGFVDNK
jgi:uncharacterized alkaline shock family protein YloU